MDDEIFENMTNEFGIPFYRRVDLGVFIGIAPIEDFDADERQLAASYGD